MTTDDLMKVSPIEFEKICKSILETMNFNVATTKTVGDGGIDLIATREDVFFSGKYIIQCKRYAGSVGEPVLRDLYGVVTAEQANKGILMTTGTFTASAKKFAARKPLELIDGEQLAKLCTGKNIRKRITSELELSSSDKIAYDEIKKLVKRSPRNLKYIGALIAILEKGIFDVKYSKNDTILKKYNNVRELDKLYPRLKSNKDLRQLYYIKMAQLRLLQGDLVEAIAFYKELYATVGKTHYTHKALISHNLQQIYRMINRTKISQRMTDDGFKENCIYFSISTAGRNATSLTENEVANMIAHYEHNTKTEYTLNYTEIPVNVINRRKSPILSNRLYGTTEPVFVIPLSDEQRARLSYIIQEI
nr:restriction endonuclease [uncultured Agathobaculum sp.]